MPELVPVAPPVATPLTAPPSYAPPAEPARTAREAALAECLETTITGRPLPDRWCAAERPADAPPRTAAEGITRILGHSPRAT